MVGVDVALTDFPDAELGPLLRAEQLAEIERERRFSTCATICVTPDDADGTNVDVYLHNEHSAHAWPSGATQDRRAWLELRVWSGEAEVLQTGVVPEGTPVDDLDDPNLWEMRDFVYDDADAPVHMFWDVRQVDSQLLPAAPVLSPAGDAATWRARRFHVAEGAVDRVTTRVRLRPMGLAVLDDLIESGDLDPAIRNAMPSFDVAPTVLEWTPQSAIEHEGYGACVETNAGGCGAVTVGAEPPR